jgi:hypothetical protein
MNTNIFTFGITGSGILLLLVMTSGTAYSQTPTLGEPFYVEQSKATGLRVLDVTHGLKIEVSFAGNGTINGNIYPAGNWRNNPRRQGNPSGSYVFQGIISNRAISLTR